MDFIKITFQKKRHQKNSREDTEVTEKNTNKNEEECIKNDKETIYANCFEGSMESLSKKRR